MRPPCCALCNTDFPPHKGGLVYFRRTAADQAWHRDLGVGVGHPPEARWFCAAHLKAARALKHLSAAEALEAMG